MHVISRRSLGACAVIALLAALFWYQRGPIFVGLADLWVVSDPLQRADVAVVLGGNVEDRPFAAANYFHQGLVGKIVISNPHQGPAERLGAAKTDAAIDRAVLIKLGVPESAIETFGDSLKDTNDEAVALKVWAQQAGVHSVIIPTEIFSARRVRWIFNKVAGSDLQISVVAVRSDDYDQTNWWTNNYGIIAFQNEILKYVYYRFAH